MTTKSARKVTSTIPRQSSAPTRALRVTEPHAASTPLNYHTNINFWVGRQRSLLAALAGVGYVLRTQPNVWIELSALAVVMGAGLWFGITAVEWAILGLTVASIVALEAVNTAIETVVDLVSPQYHSLAKIAKDTAAGALVIAVLGSIFVAAMIFVPRLWVLLR